MRAQMRAATQRAATLIFRAEDELTEAGAVIANGYLRLDHAEWIRVVEKRRAALGRELLGEGRLSPSWLSASHSWKLDGRTRTSAGEESSASRS